MVQSTTTAGEEDVVEELGDTDEELGDTAEDDKELVGKKDRGVMGKASLTDCSCTFLSAMGRAINVLTKNHENQFKSP